MFSSHHFQNDPHFKAIAQNAAAMRFGAKGYPVRLLQQGLLDSGYQLPMSTSKFGAPDGIFGEETSAAVAKLQSKLDLVDDSVVGFKSVEKFDTVFSAVPAGFSPPPAIPPTSPGATGDPAQRLKEISLDVIGPGSPIFNRDWEVKWRPTPKSKELSFKMLAFFYYGFELNQKIADGKIKFTYLKREKHPATAVYIANTRKFAGATIKANTVVLLKKDELANVEAVRQVMLHELTHAVLDMTKAARNHLFNEIIAYIAAALYSELAGKVLGGELVLKAGIFKEATTCALFVLARMAIPQSNLEKLAKAIESHKAYHGARHSHLVNNGIN